MQSPASSSCGRANLASARFFPLAGEPDATLALSEDFPLGGIGKIIQKKQMDLMSDRLIWMV